MNDNSNIQELIISKEKAVFWMDARGRWCNQYGPFEHPKIIAYFHAAIRLDQNGYFVEQFRNDLREKVYFRYVDTPLFVVNILDQDPLLLILNTGKKLVLDPHQLFIREDQLYVQIGAEYAKFSERMLIEFSAWFEYTSEGLIYCRNEDNVKIREDGGAASVNSI